MTSTTWDSTPVMFKTDGAELRTVDIGGDISVAFVRFVAGTDMTPAFKGLPDDLCDCPHWGYVIKGRIKLHMTDGSAPVYSAGDAFYWAPGHAPEALEDCEFLDFSPSSEFRKVVDHVKAAVGG
ncbi:hypothetical protein [Streptomyces sp. NPDC012888]|uniref:hypothetical protein n=1 Tax=Streptomyces sp. NPDC012888 TaxID=3364855 RepID=UPI0036AF199C